MDKHYIYALKLNGQYFYAGYTDRDVHTRKREHIREAQYPNADAVLNTVIRGENTEKHKWILSAPDDIEIDIIWEGFQNQEADEAYYIKVLKEQGHPLTNVLAGSTWCPHPDQFQLDDYKPKKQPKKRTAKPLPQTISPITPSEVYDKMLNAWIDSMEYSIKIKCEPEKLENYWPGAKYNTHFNPNEAAQLHRHFSGEYKKVQRVV